MGLVRPTFALRVVIWVALAGWMMVALAGGVTAQLRVGLIDALSSPSPSDLKDLQLNDTLTSTLEILEVVGTVAVAAALIAWLFRARANALAIQDYGQQWGKPWLIFGWIVPLANFWIPKQIVEDIWSVSAPAAPGGKQRVYKSVLVTAWWFTWLVYSIGGQVLSRTIGSRDDLASLRSAAQCTVILAPFGIISAVLLAVVVWRIGRFQEAQAARIAAALT